MSTLEIFLTAFSLSLDAVAVSIAAASLNSINQKQAIKIALFFGMFQFTMPMIGYLAGIGFKNYLSQYGGFIGFIILLSLGCKMLWESIRKPKSNEIENEKHITETKTLLLLSVATSIDALVVGITFNFMAVDLWLATVVIGATTFLLCIIGIYLGNKSRKLFGNRIEIAGAAILIFMAFKLLLF